MIQLFNPLDLTYTRNFRTAKVSSHIFAAIRDAIVQLKLTPGMPLSEVEIARQFGVSKQPVREAFIKLEEAELLEIRPQRGSFVRLISLSEVSNAHFLRTAIEVAIVRAAAELADQADIAALEEILANQKQQEDEDSNVEFLRLDEEFHQALTRSARRESAWRVLDNLKAQTDRVRFLSLPRATPIKTLIQQHEDIVRSIEKGDPASAETAMRKHLTELQISLPKLAATHHTLFSE